MYKDIIEKVLLKARGVSQTSEVFLISSEETPVQFEANRLKSVRNRQSHSIALRIFKNGRIGYAVSSNFEDIDGLVAAAAETAAFGAEVDFELPLAGDYAPVETYDPATLLVSLDSMVNLGENVITRLLEHYPRLVCEARVSKENLSVSIANSRGLEANYRKTGFELGVEGTLINGTDMLFVGDGRNSCHPVLDIEVMIADTLRQLEWAQTQSKIKSGSLPVIFTPNGVASAFMAPLMSGFNGKMVLEGASPMGNKMGQKVFDKNFNLCDDATLPYQPQSHLFDDEGVKSQRLPLIEEGVVRHFFYDLKTAARAKAQSTGHATRGSSLPVPSPTSFVISSGNTGLSEMLAEIKEGLVIEHLMGADQGNILGGDFSGNVLLGYKIEHGKITGRVKDTVVSGNVYGLLKNIGALGSDGRWVGGRLYTPSIFCPAVSVASQE
jgi:PmbA protein